MFFLLVVFLFFAAFIFVLKSIMSSAKNVDNKPVQPPKKKQGKKDDLYTKVKEYNFQESETTVFGTKVESYEIPNTISKVQIDKLDNKRNAKKQIPNYFKSKTDLKRAFVMKEVLEQKF